MQYDPGTPIGSINPTFWWIHTDELSIRTKSIIIGTTRRYLSFGYCREDMIASIMRSRTGLPRSARRPWSVYLGRSRFGLSTRKFRSNPWNPYGILEYTFYIRSREALHPIWSQSSRPYTTNARLKIDTRSGWSCWSSRHRIGRVGIEQMPSRWPERDPELIRMCLGLMVCGPV